MEKNNFIIFGQGRSGSNLLRTLLNSHPQIYCDIEIFNHNLFTTFHDEHYFQHHADPVWARVSVYQGQDVQSE